VDQQQHLHYIHMDSVWATNEKKQRYWRVASSTQQKKCRPDATILPARWEVIRGSTFITSATEACIWRKTISVPEICITLKPVCNLQPVGPVHTQGNYNQKTSTSV